MPFPSNLGVITCRCVVERGAPILCASHAGGDWQVYCHWDNHDFNDEEAQRRDLVLVHVEHLLALDATIGDVCDLPMDMGAERAEVGSPWVHFEDTDE
jgi:hypothetical protein